MIYSGKSLIMTDWERIYNYLLENDPWICDPAVVRRNLSMGGGDVELEKAMAR